MSTFRLRVGIFGVIICLGLAGCGRQEESTTTESETSPAPPSPSETAIPARSQPNLPVEPVQPQQWLSEAQAHQQAGDYDKAAQQLLAIQQQQHRLTQQQSDAYWKQMSAFQADLAARVAAGDPNAKAAAERLRAAASR